MFRLAPILLLSFCALAAHGSIYETSESATANLISQLETAPASDQPRLLNEIAESYTYQNGAKLREYAHQALAKAVENGNVNEEVRALRNLGTSYHIAGDFERALHFLNKGDSLEGCNDLSMKANIKMALSLIYLSSEIWDPAETLLEEAYNGFESVDSKFDMARVRLNQTRIALEKHNLNDALKYFKDAKTCLKLSGSDALDGHLFLIEGLIFIEQKRYEEATTSLFSAIHFFEERNFTSALCQGLAKLALCYQQTGKTKESNQLAQRTILIDDGTSAPRPVMESYRILAENAADSGDDATAYEMLKRAQSITETLREIDLSNQLTILQNFKQFQLDSRERITLRRINHTQTQMLTLGSLLFTAVGLMLLLLVRKNSTLRKSQKTEHELTVKLKAQQDAMLSRNKDLAEMITHRDRLYSIVAHDLKSPIGALHSLMQTLTREDLQKEDTLRLLQSLAPSVQSTYELIDRLVEWAQTQHMELNPKPEVLSLYPVYQIAFEQMEPFMKRKNITFHQKVAINHKVYFDHGMLVSIMRSLLSNAVKFTNLDGIIEIQSLPDLSGITITNSGFRIPNAVIEALNTNQTVESSFGTAGEKGTGLGLIIIRTLLQANGGAIHFETNDHGTTAIVHLPKPDRKLQQPGQHSFYTVREQEAFSD